MLSRRQTSNHSFFCITIIHRFFHSPSFSKPFDKSVLQNLKYDCVSWMNVVIEAFFFVFEYFFEVITNGLPIEILGRLLTLVLNSNNFLLIIISVLFHLLIFDLISYKFWLYSVLPLHLIGCSYNFFWHELRMKKKDMKAHFKNVF